MAKKTKKNAPNHKPAGNGLRARRASVRVVMPQILAGLAERHSLHEIYAALKADGKVQVQEAEFFKHVHTLTGAIKRTLPELFPKRRGPQVSVTSLKRRLKKLRAQLSRLEDGVAVKKQEIAELFAKHGAQLGAEVH